MPYYEEVVADYLQSGHRFIRREYLIDLDKTPQPAKGRSWYVDVLALDFRQRTVWLCEVSYAKSLYALSKRLKQWSDNWDAIQRTLFAEIELTSDWRVCPWAFTPENLKAVHDVGLKKAGPLVFEPRWTPLEETTPWRAPDAGQKAMAAVSGQD